MWPNATPEFVKFGRYILLDRINVGGMAEVFRGKMAGVDGFERMVALKRILPNISADPDFIEMFVDEAKLTVQLQHANIAQVFDLGKVENAYYIAMEYVSGVDLRTMWDRARKRKRLLPVGMSCYIMQRCCEGLDAAHRKKDQQNNEIGLVHRDVSPQNILISFEGEVKVIDFGIAKSRSKISKTQAGQLKGKFGYMSPEQVRGTELDNRSDIFACGTVLYELLVGERLFLGNSDFSTLEKVRNVEIRPPTDVNKSLSPELERIVMKALARDRKERYRWASEMAEDLQRYLFSGEQAFGRTDLQRYLQQHFKEEMDAERGRIDRYAEVTFESFKGEDKAAHLGVATKAAPIAAPAVVPETPAQVAAPVAAPIIVPQPTMSPRVQTRLPGWVAGIIGALVAGVIIMGSLALWFATAKPEQGTLTLEVKPERVEIFLNEKLVSNSSPITLDHLEPNTYVVTVKSEGYQTLIRAVSVGEGEQRHEYLELEKAAP